MSEADSDVQRWLQLLVDDKLTFHEFALLGHSKGYTPVELLDKCMGVSVTMKIPAEKNS